MDGGSRCCCSREQVLGILTAIGSYLLEFSFGYSNTIGWFPASLDSFFIDLGIKFYDVVLAFSGGIFLTMWSVNNGMVAFLFTNSVLFGIGIGLSFTVTLKCTVAVYGQAVGFDAISLVIVATLNGIFNCVGYVIARVACSKASFKMPLILFLLLITTFSGLFPLVKKVGLESFVLYVFCVFGLHFAMTAVNVVMTVANNAAIVPLADFGTNLAFCFCSASSAIIFSVITSYQPIDRHYDIFFWFVASVGVLEIMLALTLQDMACPLKLMRGRFFASSKLEIKEADGQPEAGDGGTAS
ncbi:unnamed protein product [Taenia asiatica]|uniref:DUF4203 domain-containing protein n=1 Tax=Taenia asiatica TaxID=60517 RepID=A0A0R3W2M2_TAEAS|nr:unnamed protein product [Taenia asiatica]